MKTSTFFLLSVLILMSMRTHSLANSQDEETIKTHSASKVARPSLWGRRPIFSRPWPIPRLPFPKPRPQPYPYPYSHPDPHPHPYPHPHHNPHPHPWPPKSDKCWLPIVKVKNCSQKIIEVYWSRHFEQVSKECCEAVIEVGQDCHAKAVGPFSVELYSYCSSKIAPPPSTLNYMEI
ncbi:hypothetical protein LguiA_009918 [Lonicera macranthoides]